MPSAGNPSQPNIMMGSRMQLMSVESAKSFVSVNVSPCALKMNMMVMSMKNRTEPAAVMMKYSSAGAKMAPEAPDAVRMKSRNTSEMMVKKTPAIAASTNACPTTRSASLMSLAPICIDMMTPDPTVSPNPNAIMMNSAIWEMLTAAIASGDILLTQKVSARL